MSSAEKYERQAIEIFQATVSRNYPDHAVALANLGYILTQRGEYAEAEQLLTEALQIERTVFGEDNERSGANRGAPRTSLRSPRRPNARHRGDAKRGQNREQGPRLRVII